MAGVRMISESKSGVDVDQVVSDIPIGTQAPEGIVAPFQQSSIMDIPADVVFSTLDVIHNLTNLPWWASIATMTVAFRTALFPLAVMQHRNQAAMKACQPELAQLQESMKNIDPSLNPQEMLRRRQVSSKKMNELMKEYGAGFLKPLALGVAQIPIFVSVFYALRQLGARFPEAVTGGMLWFPDLTAADPYHILPFLSAASTLLLQYVSTPPGSIENPMMKTMQRVFQGIILLSIPFLWNMPSALFVYWMTSNIITVLQTVGLRTNIAKKLFNLDEIKIRDRVLARRTRTATILKDTDLNIDVSKLKANRPRQK